MSRVLLAGMLLGVAVLGGGQIPSSKMGVLRGEVTDAMKVTIPTAYVLVHCSGKSDVVAKLDREDATFSVNLEPGIYAVFISADGFAPIAKTIKITSGHSASLHARLKPDMSEADGVIYATGR